jgi:cytochrome c oxidase subunit 3
MSMWTLFIALVTAIIVWGLLVRHLTAKPWLVAGDADYIRDIEPIDHPAKKVGLFFFLGAITSLFSLFITAYIMRMSPHHGSDWIHINEPGILWVNTLLLLLSSIAMQFTRFASDKQRPSMIKIGMIVSGVFTIAFLAGQFLAWQQLSANGLFLLSNPAVSFFYLLTGVHALHLLGGLWVWGKTIYRLWFEPEPTKVNQTIEMCTVYWHYLLIVWLVLFVLLLST